MMLFVLGNKFIRFLKRVEFSNVENLQVGLDEANDASTMADGEVEIDDGETFRKAIHEREQTGREAVDARECEHIQRLAMLREPRPAHIFVGRFYLTCLDVRPAHQAHGIVEEQVALRLSPGHQQYGILVGLMLACKPPEVYIVKDIDIMNQYGFIIA